MGPFRQQVNDLEPNMVYKYRDSQSHMSSLSNSLSLPSTPHRPTFLLAITPSYSNMSHGKQFTLYTHISGPNGWKVASVLEELGLTFESVFFNFQAAEQKNADYLKLNPNGRIPTIVDHGNNDFVLWESDAILLYLVDRYDKEKRLTVTDEREKYQLLQWLFFQSSGQGPYFGQVAWFTIYHAEKIPSAIERYKREILRVFGVLEAVLSKQDWLVGGKVTIADISFATWNNLAINNLVAGFEGFDFEKDFPATAAWHNKLLAIPSVKSVIDQRAAMLQKH
ncbi:unnamed protein product [Somion occarium]|uniref:Glutathione S-transferase n=1 Tax=Somion occarium TaxID=3059160 RepID=A0ABP1DRZ3_9APHY